MFILHLLAYFFNVVIIDSSCTCLQMHFATCFTKYTVDGLLIKAECVCDQVSTARTVGLKKRRKKYSYKLEISNLWHNSTAL